jgi:hypothetical protein
VDDDVVVDDHDLCGSRRLGLGADEQPSARGSDPDAGGSDGCSTGDDVRDCETAFHTITLLVINL